ncbi:uncharacterized protein LOC114649411 [Erpetoichthys calabaricus]|uniref:uncharacterized protein LOC114649411 n=1 Tax=Erpetoichthys calabaricus TaxID=27687 RepID=UPI002234229D|nr:uncharacterized protein LOC114649411 [Erpetoichthys calabaricus]
MDERHWWIATKVQETFRVCGKDSPTELESFFTQPEHLELVDEFLKADGLGKLFFYASTENQEEMQLSSLNIVENLDKITDSQNVDILYFIRHKTQFDIDPIRMEQDIFCGEIRKSVIDSLRSLVNDIYIPLLKAQKDWGICTQPNVTQFLSSLDKYAIVLHDSAAATRSEKQQILKRPVRLVSAELMQQRMMVFDAEIISENETILSDWMKTLEEILKEGGDDRILDINTTPITELDRWRRRQRTLESIMEQLKGKECKNVIGLLIATKSRLLKKWKALDISITDIANDTKGKVKYLEALSRHFEALANENNPANLMNTVLPGIFTAFKQMDTVSRFLSRNGYLGLLLTKICNQLTLTCRDFLHEAILLGESDDRLWEKIEEEMATDEYIPVQMSLHLKGKTKEKRLEIDNNHASIYNRIQTSLMLQTYFLDALRQLRENVGGSHGLHHFSSSSSLSTMQGKQPSVSAGRKASLRKASLASSIDHDYHGAGVSLTDEESIMHNLDAFCYKLRQFCHVLVTLQQYKILTDQTKGILKPNQDDLSLSESGEEAPLNEASKTMIRNVEHLDSLKADFAPHSSESWRTGLNVAPLQTLIEEDEGQSNTEIPVSSHELNCERLSPVEENTDSLGHESVDEEQNEEENTLSFEEKKILQNLYNWDDPEEEGQCLPSVINEYLANLIQAMSSGITADVLLNVEKREADRFEDAYSEFLVMNQALERYITVYMQAVFLRKMRTVEAIAFLKRFTAVSQRQSIQPMITECYVEALNWFYDEIKEVQETYERHKDDPILARNIPPAAGAIYWSRQLLSRIEEPMKVFKEMKVTISSYSYSQTVKLYNRIAAALVTYETLWYQEWKSRAEGCLRGLNATLLIRDPNTQEHLVNSDQRILQLFEESKWMSKLKLQVPQSVLLSLKQEKKYKMYKRHLEDLLKEFQQIKRAIPECLASEFTVYLEAVNQSFQPGLSVLSWSSVDIEAFLHQAYSDISRLKHLADRVIRIKEDVIDGILAVIYKSVLFNGDELLSGLISPEEFLQRFTSSVQKSKAELESKLKTIMTAISDIRFIIFNSKGTGPGLTKDPVQLKPSNKQSHLRVHQTLSKGRRQASLSSNSCKSDSFEENASSLHEYFYGEICRAIFGCIFHSLLVLAYVSGCEMSRITKATLNSQKQHHSTAFKDTDNVSKKNNIFTLFTENYLSEFLLNHAPSNQLRCHLKLRLTIPNITIDPSLEVAQEALKESASVILNITDIVKCWPGKSKDQVLSMAVKEDEDIKVIFSYIGHVISNLKPVIEKHIFSYSYYDFLWKDDLNSQFAEMTSKNPEHFIITREVERLQSIEGKIHDIPAVFQGGCIWLDCSLIKDSLAGFAGVWKFTYASVLHQEARERLNEILQYRNTRYQQLMTEVQSLEQLNDALCLLEELQDMENKIDMIYQPVERMYKQLRSYQMRLSRDETTEVDNLRENWAELMSLAENVRKKLLKEKKIIFEQELDKQVKSFSVDVIQLRNLFDTRGPAAPGLRPEEAVYQLQRFQEKFSIYDVKQKTLNSLQRLFGVTMTAFPELDRTGKDLRHLGALYELFQKFLAFDQRFRDTLWAEVDLPQSTKEVRDYWSQCQAWNDQLTDWDAYNEMARQIKFYIDCIPVLHILATKEIRNRHWLQVMAVTGSSFPLEATVFKLHHLLDIDLLKHQEDIISIAKAATEELQLEMKMRTIEDEWTEHVLNFELYKNYGPVLLVKEDTLQTLEQVENTRVLLAQMLTSKHIGPLREDAASWSEKLKEVGMVLEIWIEVQDMWHNLEPVFTIPSIWKELYQDAKRFSKVDKNWIKMMHLASNTRNILQCCCAEEASKELMLKHMFTDLETCCQSLAMFLGRKRQAFPRFYFLPDFVLLSFLSCPTDFSLLCNHFSLLFSGIHNVRLESSSTVQGSSISAVEQLDTMVLPGFTERLGSASVQSLPHYSDNESFISRSARSVGLSVESPVSTNNTDPKNSLQIVSVISKDGESLDLREEVPLSSSIEEWLTQLQKVIATTLETCIGKAASDVRQGVNVDEWTYKYPFQIARLALLYCWTADCEAAIIDLKSDRKAFPGAVKKYSGIIFRLSSILSKKIWKHNNDPITCSQKLKVENMVMFAVYLRDVLESLNTRKVRDVTDFEWRRALRFYWDDNDGNNAHRLCIHDAQYESGFEFYGASVNITLSPVTEKAFFALSHILKSGNGVIVQGDHSSGKTETVKIVLNQNFSLFLTARSKTDYKSLPSDILALFRTVSITLPGYSLILKAHLTALGFKSPKMLSHRLQLVTDLIKHQLPEKIHHHFSLASLKVVLHRAAQKKDIDQDERTEGRQDKQEIKPETGRTSQCSSITSAQALVASAISPSLSVRMVQSPDKRGKTASSNAMTPVARLEHALTGETLHECLAPRMEGDDLLVFSQIVRDVFGDIVDLSNQDSYFQSSPSGLEKAILKAAKNNNLIPHTPWVNKVKQLYTLSQINQGIIVAGPPGAGKSSCISTLIQALSLISSGNQSQLSSVPVADKMEPYVHKLIKFSPLAVDNFTLLFGSQPPSQNWIDGIITYTWRKAFRTCSNTWICFDGPLNSSWMDNFSSVLGNEKFMQLSSGEHIHLSSNMHLLFETCDLELATPSSISQTGILYIDSDITGWRPLASAWLMKRNEQENSVLSKVFNTALDPIFNYVLREIKYPIPLTEVGLFQTISNLLGAMLNDKAQSLGGQFHIERLFLFCLIWTVGGLLQDHDKKKFSDVLKIHSTSLPDYDEEISVFDYYVDESGEWELWTSHLSEQNRAIHTDVLGEVFIETVDTLAVRTFMEYANMASQNILLVGPPGCGKTTLLNDFISGQEKFNAFIKRTVFCATSKARNLQQIFEEIIVHRQGFVYGARDGKTLQMLIEDINLPESQCCGELLRQVLDDKMLLKLNKPFEWRHITDLVVQATISLPEFPNDNSISKRLLRNFAVLYLPTPEGAKLKQVLFSVLQANMEKNNAQQLDNNLHAALVSASCNLLESIKSCLCRSTSPGRQHYQFCLREIAKTFQCLSRLSNKDRQDADLVTSFWKHEIERIFGDRLCQHSDLRWFQENLKNIEEKHLYGLQFNNLHGNFITFPIEAEISKKPYGKSDIIFQVQRVEQIHDVQSYVRTYLQQYNGELENDPLQVELSENTLALMVRIHRVLSYSHSGNLVIIGSPGSYLRSLLKLSLYIAGVPLLQSDTSHKTNFFRCLKLAIQQAATENKASALLLTARELEDPFCLDIVNSILISGEYSSLFSAEEMQDLVKMLNSSIQREQPLLVYDPYNYLASKVKLYIHFLICLPPHHRLLGRDSQKALETLNQTRIDINNTQQLVSDLIKQYGDAKTAAADILNKLASKASALEQLKGQLGMGAESLQVFLTQEESDSEELEEEDLLKDDTVDEYDEAFYKMKEISSKSQANKLYEDLENAKYDLEEARNNLKHAKNQVMHWCSKVDKSCIERISRCQNPPFLLGQILEMVLVMLGLLPYAYEMDLETPRPLRISTEFSEGRRSQKSMASLSARNSKKLITKGSKMDIKEKVDKNWWKTLQNYVSDSSKFVELIHNIAQLEDGLQDEVLKEVEAYLAKPTEGNLGVTGEGSLLADAAPYATPQTITPAKKFSASDSNTGKGGITIAAARYSSEEAAVLVAFVVALVEYTHLCGPLKACLRRVQELEGAKQDLEIHKQELETPSDKMEDQEETESEKILFTENDLPLLITEVQQLQSEYDIAIAHKHKLETELQSHKENLHAAQNILKKLLASKLFLKKCSEWGLTLSQKILFKESPLMPFLFHPIEIKRVQMNGAAMNLNTETISCILKYEDCCSTWVAEHEVECRPSFRLVLHTAALPEQLPAEVAAFCKPVYFDQDRSGLREQLLNRFIQLEKIRLGEEYKSLQEEYLDNMQELWDMETNIVKILSAEISLLNSLSINKKLCDLKQRYEEALETKSRLEISEKSILSIKEGFRDIALRGAVMFDIAYALRSLNSVYHVSYNQLLGVFDSSIANSERYSVKTIVDRVTYNIFCYVGKYLLEKDRIIYSLLLALEMETSLGHISPGMVEFIFSPDLCSDVMKAIGAKTSEARQQAKNPFDWMTDEQFKNVQILATFYSWFWDLFDRMYKDGKEMTWKALCESDQPENPTKVKGPEGLDELSHLQRLLVIRAVRNDRFIQAASLFISGVLGKKYSAAIPSDLHSCLQQSKAQTPILLLYDFEADVPWRLVSDLSKKRSCALQVITVCDSNCSETARVMQLIEQAMVKGEWLLLENIQNSTHFMMTLESLLQEKEDVNKNFRIWVSAQTSSSLTVRLLHSSVKIVVDTPKNIKDGLMKYIQQVDTENLDVISYPEWLPAVHNLCFLHCAVRIRATCGGIVGWNCKKNMTFGIQEYLDALQALTEEFHNEDSETDGKVISWTGIRYLLTEIIYGRHITDENDRLSLTSLVDFWMSTSATKKDNDITKLRYRIPAAFFSSGTPVNILMQALDSIPRYSLDVPEGVSLHNAPNLHFGDEYYVASELHGLYSSLSPSRLKEFPLSQTSTILPDSSSHTGHGLQSVAPVAPLTYYQLKSPTEPELWEICSSILTKLPKGWSKDVINDRLKKLGGNTPFNLFIKKELSHLMNVLSEVRKNIQTIKNCTEALNIFGDHLPPAELSVARDLIQQRAAKHWLTIGKMASPDGYWTTMTWISDLQQRVLHFEKILQLGQEKMPTYWLGAFKNPKGLLGIFKQQCVRQHAERTGTVEPMVFQTVITQRDKEHMRDPPQEGMFVYGLYVWGAAWHKTEAGLIDASPKQSPVSLPVIHLRCMSRSEKANHAEVNKTTDTYQCPVYMSSAGPRDPIFHLDIWKDNVPAARWALRGMKATLQPF